MFTITDRLPGENNKAYSYRLIKQAIMELELKPGQAFSEVELADVLQISRTPIREVMASLREEHLIEVMPQVGTYVSKIKSQLIDEAAFMRFVLEREVLKLAANEVSPTLIFDLKRNVMQQEELLKTPGNERAFHQLDQQFHATIFQAMRKEHIWGSINRISTHYNRIRLLSEMEHSFERAIEQHKRIIDVIEQQQVDGAEGIVYQHIIEPMKQWDTLFEPGSPYASYFDLTTDKPVFL